MKSQRILVLLHSDLVPEDKKNILNENSPVSLKDLNGLTFLKELLTPHHAERFRSPWITEFDVIYHLVRQGHQVRLCGVISDLKKIGTTVDEFKPHIVFNLLEEFDGEVVFDSHVVSYLELQRIAYTGNNPRALMIARDKSLAKKILSFHRIRNPKFAVFPKNRIVKTPKHLTFPAIVKCLDEDASLGLSKASIVNSEEKLRERVQFINQKIGVDAIVEEFIPGREFYVGVLGNYRLETLPVWEVLYENSDDPEKEFYSRAAKWNDKYRQRKGIKSVPAQLLQEEKEKIQELAKKVYKVLGLNGYARIDVRMNERGLIYVIEANPNPNIALDDEFAESGLSTKKWNYPELLEKIISLGLSWHNS